MSFDRTSTTILRGPALVLLGTVPLYSQGGVKVKTMVKTFPIMADAYGGPLDKRIDIITTEISFKPAGQITAGILAACYPHTAATPGASLLGASDVSCYVWPLNGKEKFEFKNAYVSKMPKITASSVKTFIDTITIRCIGANNTAMSSAAWHYVNTATVAFTDTSFATSQVMTLPYTAVLGALAAPWTGIVTKAGWEISFDIPTEDIITDTDGLVDVLYKENPRITARCQPIGITATDVYALMQVQYTGTARGATILGTGKLEDLVIDAGVGYPKFTLKNMHIETAPTAYEIGKDRIDNLEFVSCRQVASNVLADLFSIGIHAA